MHKLCFFVPDSHVEQVKAAIFDAGGGRLGDYDHCCWQVLGQGQFRPLAGSDPFIGEQGRVERLPEWKVELVLEDGLVDACITALRASHPYQTPAYEVWPVRL
ncbi:NGG1p interacting factor NIF3 [Pseudomonas sp. ABC1]|uniref:Nif3-like dinuclear metal center hexameric protein n=1 Tax=Pseudomonas sp. ABC1 TaxID=2748080 RepID=UPI0015C2EBA7|nr:YqfO family protein [Pseudomonas sp. ABC1]QLF92748.1 NGG1p interacting factor NIF3 [Pseudomonas sp. ABC1]